MANTAKAFDGKTYNPALDQNRLSNQLERVRELMLDGEWRTLSQIQAVVGGSESAVSARLRDLRKVRFGGYLVPRRRVEGGLFEYCVKGPAPAPARPPQAQRRAARPTSARQDAPAAAAQLAMF